MKEETKILQLLSYARANLFVQEGPPVVCIGQYYFTQKSFSKILLSKMTSRNSPGPDAPFLPSRKRRTQAGSSYQVQRNKAYPSNAQSN